MIDLSKLHALVAIKRPTLDQLVALHCEVERVLPEIEAERKAFAQHKSEIAMLFYRGIGCTR